MRKATFLEKLRLMLADPANMDLIRWIDTSRFVVINPESLAAHILPNYYKHSNFNSFVRQLHGYGFHKEAMDDGSVQFYHTSLLANAFNPTDFSRKQSSHKSIIENLRAEVDDLKEEIRILRLQNETLQTRLSSGQTRDLQDDYTDGGDSVSDFSASDDAGVHLKQELDMSAFFGNQHQLSSPKFEYPGLIPPARYSNPLEFPCNIDDMLNEEAGFNNSGYENSNYSYQPYVADEYFALGF